MRFECGGMGGRLLVVAPHLVIDGVSWRILLDEIERRYAELSAASGEVARPEAWEADARRPADEVRVRRDGREAARSRAPLSHRRGVVAHPPRRDREALRRTVSRERRGGTARGVGGRSAATDRLLWGVGAAARGRGRQ